ncbi:MAG: rhomboid family intramembrane serine protease [Pseudomonadota bacterium]
MSDSDPQQERKTNTPEDGEGLQTQPQPALNIPVILIFFSMACVGLHIFRTEMADFDLNRQLIIFFAFIPLRYAPDFIALDLPTIVAPITYSLLHGDWIHLGINLIWLVAFGSPVAWRLGWYRTVLFWIITSACAAGFHLMLYFGDEVPLIGASGAVSGFMGAAARFGFRTDGKHPRRGFVAGRMSILQTLKIPSVVGFLIVWVVVNYLSGTGFMGIAGDRSIAWEAHIGGLLAGFLLIGFIDRKP